MVHTVVPHFRGGRVDGGILIIAVRSAGDGIDVFTVSIFVEIRGPIAVLVYTVVPDFGRCRIDGRIRIITVRTTRERVDIFTIAVLVVV